MVAMIERRRIASPFLWAGLLAGSLQAQGVADIWEPREANLSQVRDNGSSFKNVHIRFKAYFVGLGTLHNPFFTRFTRSEYANFGAWGEEQKLWMRKEYDNPVSTFFVQKSRTSRVLQQIYDLKRYQLVEAVGIVRNIFQGEPWIEVLSINPLGQEVTVSTLAHMNRAVALIKNHNWAKAGAELSLAKTADIPEKTLAWLQAYLGECLLRTGKPVSAATEIEAALAALPREQYVLGLHREIMKDPKAAIDNQVTLARVSREMLPMWEAVETERKNAKRRPGRKDKRDNKSKPVRVIKPRIGKPKSTNKALRKTKPAEPGK